MLQNRVADGVVVVDGLVVGIIEAVRGFHPMVVFGEDSLAVILIGASGHHVEPAVVLLLQHVEFIQDMDVVEADVGDVEPAVFRDGHQGVVRNVDTVVHHRWIGVVFAVVPVVHGGGKIDIVIAPGHGAESGLESVFFAHEARGVSVATLIAGMNADRGFGKQRLRRQGGHKRKQGRQDDQVYKFHCSPHRMV